MTQISLHIDFYHLIRMIFLPSLILDYIDMGHFSSAFQLWQLLAGLAVFMIGMGLLEEGLKKLAGRNFKLFLRRHARHKLQAIGGAALVTGVLQSSSIVNLMILAFAGTGIITMQHALALMLGTNLGTTLSTWVVASIGFKISISSYAFPLLAIAGITRTFFSKEQTIFSWLTFVLGISFLFMGLGMMQEAMSALVISVDLSQLSGYHPIVFLASGIVITSLIQSSSATVAIVLAALHVKAITLSDAMAIVLGSEIGTTVKLWLAAANGSAIKKKIAAGNSIINGIMAGTIFLMLSKVHQLITGYMGLKNPLIALSFFQTFINLAGISLFLPFLKPFAAFLDKLFKSNSNLTLYISKVPPSDADVSQDALRKETVYFTHCIIQFFMDAFDKGTIPLGDQQREYVNKTLTAKYDHIKLLHGSIYEYCIELQKGNMANETAKSLTMLISSARNGMYAAKSIKDALIDVEQLKNSANETKYAFYLQSGDIVATQCQKLANIINKDRISYFEEITEIYHSVQQGYTHSLNSLYQKEMAGMLNETEISTLINYNREIYSGLKSLVLAIKDCLLNEKDAAYFDDLPGFIK